MRFMVPLAAGAVLAASCSAGDSSSLDEGATSDPPVATSEATQPPDAGPSSATQPPDAVPTSATQPPDPVTTSTTSPTTTAAPEPTPAWTITDSFDGKDLPVPMNSAPSVSSTDGTVVYTGASDDGQLTTVVLEPDGTVRHLIPMDLGGTLAGMTPSFTPFLDRGQIAYVTDDNTAVEVLAIDGPQPQVVWRTQAQSPRIGNCDGNVCIREYRQIRRFDPTGVQLDSRNYNDGRVLSGLGDKGLRPGPPLDPDDPLSAVESLLLFDDWGFGEPKVIPMSELQRQLETMLFPSGGWSSASRASLPELEGTDIVVQSIRNVFPSGLYLEPGSNELLPPPEELPPSIVRSITGSSLFAYNAETADIIWTKADITRSGFSSVLVTMPRARTEVIDGEIELLAHTVQRLDPLTGEVLWSHRLDEPVETYDTAITSTEDYVFVSVSGEDDETSTTLLHAADGTEVAPDLDVVTPCEVRDRVSAEDRFGINAMMSAVTGLCHRDGRPVNLRQRLQSNGALSSRVATEGTNGWWYWVDRNRRLVGVQLTQDQSN